LAFSVLRAALPRLRKNKSGLIINVGSILGRVTIPFMGLYGATKFAVEAMTESYRYELSQLGVDIVVVQPSAYPTGLYGHLNAGDGDRTIRRGCRDSEWISPIHARHVWGRRCAKSPRGGGRNSQARNNTCGTTP
jgi:short-subunit dehydrogenase